MHEMHDRQRPRRRVAITALLLVSGVVPAAATAAEPTEPTESCREPNVSIPAALPQGITDSMEVDSNLTTVNLEVDLVVLHTWVGDLAFELTHDDTGTMTVLLDRPGHPDTAFGCQGDDIEATLLDAAAESVEEACMPGQIPAVQGELAPFPGRLDVFDGEPLGGTWTLRAIDVTGADSGVLVAWCIRQGVADDTPVPATGFGATLALVLSALLGGAYLTWPSTRRRLSRDGDPAS